MTISYCLVFKNASTALSVTLLMLTIDYNGVMLSEVEASIYF
ncbi:hypothetical protein SAMN02787100_3264 [Chryseobacterium sp. OV279]|nr:hypothetical protein SAMN02787100_3264 [Chryseobacterium sp. OV279]